MSFNGLFEKLPTKNSCKWSVLTMGKGEWRRSRRITFGNFIIFDQHEGLVRRFTV